MFQFFKKSQSAKLTDINTIPELMSGDNEVRLLDVRTPQEYRAGHLPLSESLPLPRTEAVEELVPDKSTTVIVYCQSGIRSTQAAGILERLGYTHVINAGGIAQWKGELVQ